MHQFANILSREHPLAFFQFQHLHHSLHVLTRLGICTKSARLLEDTAEREKAPRCSERTAMPPPQCHDNVESGKGTATAIHYLPLSLSLSGFHSECWKHYVRLWSSGGMHIRLCNIGVSCFKAALKGRLPVWNCHKDYKERGMSLNWCCRTEDAWFTV